MKAPARGGFATGLVVGLLIGLGIALAVALYITKVPVPFVNKLPQRTAEQDAAEAERNKNWDPNAALLGKSPVRAPAASGVVTPAASAPLGGEAGAALPPTAPPAPTATRPARNPAAILAGQVPAAPGPAAAPGASAAPTGFDYWVQVGAYARADDAEAQRARLGLLGQQAKVLEREQAGRTVYRVRIGPFEARDEAEGLQGKLTAAGFEANLVRVER